MVQRPRLFSVSGDWLAFFLPALAAVFCAVTAGQIGFAPQSQYFLLTVLFVWRTDSGHVFATLFLILFNRDYRRTLGHRLWSAPLTAYSAIVLIMWHSPSLFPTFLGYIALMHIILQHFGWLRLIERKEGLGLFERRVDLFLLCGLIGLPIYFWHTGASAVELSYFLPNNLILRVPKEPWRYLQVIYWGFVLAAALWNLWMHRTGRILSPSRGPYFLVTVFWWYGGLVVAPVDAVFWISLITCHGWSYLLHTGETFRPSKAWAWMPGLLFLAAITVNGAWWSTVRVSWSLSTANPWLLLLIWTPLFLHYTFDSILWKGDFQKRLKACATS